MQRRLLRLGALIGVMLALGACNLSPESDAPTPTTAAGDRPVVTIVSPREGDEVIVNNQVLISTSSIDSVGVTRVQLFVSGQIVQTVQSETAGGDTAFSAILNYTPTATGDVDLEVIAYRSAIPSLPASLRLTVRQSATQIVATTQAPIVNPIPPINPIDPTCRLLTQTALNVRTGPNVAYDRILILNAGTIAPITGRLGDNSWYQIRIGTTTGWVSGSFVTLYGNCSGVIVVPAPPTPTPRVVPTLVPSNTLTRTIQPPTVTVTPGFPDLVVTSIGGSSTLTLGPGNSPVTSNYSVTITNTGSGPARQFNSTLTVSPPGVENQLGAIDFLNAQQSVVLTISLTFSGPGTYTLGARADTLNNVTPEVSEVNNGGAITVTVVAAP